MTDDDDQTQAPKTPRPDPYDREGMPPISSYPDYLQELERFKRGIKDDRHRRLYACRAADDLRAICAEFENEQMRGELTNLVNLTLRMILIENDGQVSPQTLPPF